LKDEESLGEPSREPVEESDEEPVVVESGTPSVGDTTVR